MASSAARNIESSNIKERKQIDPNPYWSSSLFHEVFLRNDAPKKYAKIWDQDAGFESFHQDFHNFVLECADEDFNTWSESDTIKNWIVHVMEMLGWHELCDSRRSSPFIEELSLTISENGRKKTYRADLVYVDEPKHKQFITKEKKPENRLREARSKATGAKMVLEAKYWDRLEQNRQSRANDSKRSDVESDDGTRHLDPNDQTLKYMDILDLDFGILTDGKTWRLFHKDLSKGDVRRFFEFDLGNLAELARTGIDNEKSREKFLNEARFFYFMFRKSSLVQSGSEPPLVYQILEYSKKYAHSIEEDLKERFIEAMGFACNEIKENLIALNFQIDLDGIRNVCESHLFNILFMRSCETRKILPLNCPDYHRISLTEVIETLDHMDFDPEKGPNTFLRHLKLAFGNQFELDGTEIYDRLIKLYKTVHDGNMGFGIAGFKESIFSKEEWKIAKNCKIRNESLLQILFCLNFTDSEFGGRKFQQIPYNFFTPRQLGSIYESFLEFKLAKADSHMVFYGNRWVEAPKSAPKTKNLLNRGCPSVSKGDLFFSPDNKDRKVTGAYYTPDPVVQFITRETLSPLCVSASPNEILSLKVCDPAMGSGHFLFSVLEYLTNAYRYSATENFQEVEETFVDSARTVLDKCIYGIDLNPQAVKLTKMSLWLATAKINMKLERLSDQIFCGNSLEGNTFVKLFSNSNGQPIEFDAFVGNPPYSKESQNKGEWIRSLLRGANPDQGKSTSSYFEVNGQPLGERNPKWLNDDYVKFFRLLQWQIDNSSKGVIGFISNHGYIDNSTFRGMRESLYKSFDTIHLIDLHGNSKKNTSDKVKDENVFDIQTGVCVAILRKDSSSKKISSATVFRCDVRGTREDKFTWLVSNSLSSENLRRLEIDESDYLFLQQDNDLKSEFDLGNEIRDIFPVNSAGIVTARDKLTIQRSKEEVWNTVKKFTSLSASDARTAFELGKDAAEWKVQWAIDDINDTGPSKKYIQKILYRPFDIRYTYYTGNSRGFMCRPRSEVMKHMWIDRNKGLVFTRPMAPTYEFKILVSDGLIDQCAVGNKSAGAGISYLAPLFVQGENDPTVNVSLPESELPGMSKEDLFYYTVATLSSTGYKTRYEKLLKSNFPKIQISNDAKLNKKLSQLGRELAQALCMENSNQRRAIKIEGKGGTNKIGKLKYDEKQCRMYINKFQYISGVTIQHWEYEIGGYRIFERWAKERKGERVSKEDLDLLALIIATIEHTAKVIDKIDVIISERGGWPLLQYNELKKAV